MRERRRRKTMSKQEDTKIKNAYTFFINAKKADNLSDATIDTYNLHISNFINTMELGDLSCSILSDPSMYQEWIEDLQEDQNKKDVTVASYCRSVRAFLYWLQDNEYCDSIVYKIPRYQKTIKICYTNDELSILLLKPSRECSEVEYQTWVFINLICATGLRLASALNVKVLDINFKEKIIYIQQTKNNKAQMIYLNDNVLLILSKYIKLFDLNSDDFLFCTAEKNKLAKRTIQDNVATYNRSLGVEKTSIHLFRHTFAKNYYLQTRDIYSLSRILGHSSIATTEQYLRDLGLTLADATVYNPQSQFAVKSTKKKRRGKLK